jgi:hypothetical protein
MANHMETSVGSPAGRHRTAVVPGAPTRPLSSYLLSLIIGAVSLTLIAVLFPAPPAFATEPCPNEEYRAASHSTELPGCRAYELVSPPDAGGSVAATIAGEGKPELTISLERQSIGFGTSGLNHTPFGDGGNLAPQLQATIDVLASGSAVFWDSQATPPETGAIEDGAVDPFRSVRTPSGWTTKDLFPSPPGFQIPAGGIGKALIGVSADGSSALIATPLALYPIAFADPQQASLGDWAGVAIYRVSADDSLAPQMIMRGELPIPATQSLTIVGNPEVNFAPLSASPTLDEVAFRSLIALEATDTCPTLTGNIDAASMYLWNASSPNGLAHVIFRFPNEICIAPNVASVATILPDGRPILMPNPAPNPPIPSSGPLVENSASSLDSSALTPLAGPAGGMLLSTTPDGSTAYVLTESNIYAVSTTVGWAGAICISCLSDQASVTYIGTSKDGSHLLFTTDQGLWEWDASSGAQLLTSATDLKPNSVIVSHNGQYVVALTAQLAGNPNGTSDIYEFSAGHPLQLITSGTSADGYALGAQSGEGGDPGGAGGVSDDGQRVVFDRTPAGGAPQVIDEWINGTTTQLSPQGSQYGYRVQAVAGDQLQDVFFLAREPLVPWDYNAGHITIYDARNGGGFPACTQGDPNPPSGATSCGAPSETLNPTGPSAPIYSANATPPSFQLAPLLGDTSHPASASKPRPLTQAQKLAKALKACKKDKSKAKRTKCEKEARKKYPKTAKKANHGRGRK